MNALCAICDEAFNNSAEICAIPCGHVFHYECLSQWLPRSATCPECRRRTTMNSKRKLYFNMNSDNTPKLDTQELQIMLDEIMSQNKELEKTSSELSSKLQISEENVKQLKEKCLQKEAALDAVKQQYDHCLKKCTEIEDLKKKQCIEIEDLKKKYQYCQERIALLRRMDGFLEKTTSEIDAMMTGLVKPRDLSECVTSLKREVASSEQKRKNLEEAFQHSQLKVMNLKLKCADYKKHLESCRFGIAEQKIKELEIKKKSLLNRVTELEKIKMKKEIVFADENTDLTPRRPLQDLKNVDKKRLNNNDNRLSKKSRLVTDASTSSINKAE